MHGNVGVKVRDRDKSGLEFKPIRKSRGAASTWGARCARGTWLAVHGLWFRDLGLVSGLVLGFELRILGFGFRVSGFRFRMSGFGFWVSGFGFRVSSFGFQFSGIGFRVSVFGVGVSDVGYRVSGVGCRNPS